MKELVKFENNRVIPSPYAMSIPEFAPLNSKELTLVYLYTDHRSPYSFEEPNERKSTLSEEFGIEFSPKIETAIQKYKDLSETHAIRLLKAARVASNKIEEYFNNIDLTELDINGKLVYSAKDLMANLKSIGDVMEGLNTLEELIIKEQERDSANRSGVKTSKYNQ